MLPDGVQICMKGIERMKRKKYRRRRRLAVPCALTCLIAVFAFGAGMLLSGEGKSADAATGTDLFPDAPQAAGTSGTSEASELPAIILPDEAAGTGNAPSGGSGDGESVQKYDAAAREILKDMTLEEKVGQMFIARCPETGAADKAEEYQPGGYILFARDFKDKSPEEVRKEIEGWQSVSRIPMLTGVDEEGGTVNRISRYPAFRAEPFQSPQELYAEGGLDAVRNDTAEKCRLLQSLEISVNFAPVCDVSENPEDFIYPRTLGQDAELTGEYVSTVVETMKEEGIGSVLKHFPGYGNNADTHTGTAYDARPYETFENSDFLPFQAGIESGADMVLVSHNVVGCMDPDLPASLSPRVHEILRKDLGFSGVIVTDDLAMEGVRSFADDGRIAVMAVQAGNDLLCCTDFEVQIPAVIEAVRSGEIPLEQINQSVLRILRMKLSLGILES